MLETDSAEARILFEDSLNGVFVLVARLEGAPLGDGLGAAQAAPVAAGSTLHQVVLAVGHEAVDRRESSLRIVSLTAPRPTSRHSMSVAVLSLSVIMR